jgi:glutathione S-transferase
MLKLYTKTHCPYCQIVLGKLDELGLDFEELNIDDEKNVASLMERGGKRQVPYLVDEEYNKEMYESGDIVNYLSNTYGPLSQI